MSKTEAVRRDNVPAIATLSIDIIDLPGSPILKRRKFSGIRLKIANRQGPVAFVSGQVLLIENTFPANVEPTLVRRYHYTGTVGNGIPGSLCKYLFFFKISILAHHTASQ